MATMSDAIGAIRALLEDAGFPAAYGDATGVTQYPYVLVWSSPGLADSEIALSGAGGFEDLLGVTVADTTSANVLVTVPKVRAVLDRVVLDVPGLYAVLRLRHGYGQPVQVDRSATLPDTNTYPSFAVDRYRLTAQPLPEEANNVEP